MKKRGLLMGTEGVLCSTVHLHRQAWETVLTLNHIRVQGIEKLDLMALSREEGLEALLKLSGTELLEAEKSLLIEEKNEQYRQLLANIDRTDLLPGIEDFLSALREEGVRLCVVTMSKNAILILRQLGMDGAFDAVCDGNDSMKKTEDKDLYHYAARLLSLSPEDCVVWENNEFHRHIARNAGFETVHGSADTVRLAIG